MTATVPALAVLAAAGVGLFAWQAWRGLPVDAFPSMMWSAMITVPFLGQWGVWQHPGIHAAGIFIVGVGLLAGDAWACRMAIHQSRAGIAAHPAQKSVSRTILLSLAGFSLAMALLHLYLAPSIPLLHLGEEGITDRELMVFREEAAKLLHVPRVLKYLFNWLVTVFSTIGIVALVLQRRYRLAGVWYALALAYAAMTTAKVPAVLLTMSVVGGLTWFVGPVQRRRIYVIALASFVVLIVAGAINSLTRSNSRLGLLFNAERHGEVDWSSMRTLADLWRVKIGIGSEDGKGVDRRPAHPEEYLLYRVVLAPVEVSNYWYAYYTDVHAREGWKGILPWTSDAQYVHPARKVGLWAYHSRFPDDYSTTINAYASADADAYAHFGWLGIVASSLLLLGFRTSLSWLGGRNGLARGLSGAAVVMFALLVPMGSVQAVMLAQGLLFYPAAIWLAGRFG